MSSIYIIYTKHFAKYFAISSIIFDLYAKYNKIVLYYIYNNLNIKNCIAILICKQKLKKKFIKTILKN